MTRPPALPCPRCTGARAEALVPIDLPALDGTGAVGVDACPSCRGAWLEATGWLPLVGRPRAVRHPSSLAFGGEPPRCPSCPVEREALGRELRRPVLVPRAIEEAPDVEVDICPSCGGAWLDAGELLRLREAIDFHAAEARAAADAAPPKRVRAAFARRPEEAMTFFEALLDVLGIARS